MIAITTKPPQLDYNENFLATTENYSWLNSFDDVKCSSYYILTHFECIYFSELLWNVS